MKPIVILSILGACAAVPFMAVGKTTASKPNILWIVTDDQRADSLACFNRAVYGTDESPLGYVESPNIDALADEGVLFTRAIVNAPACGPSRGSMHSGRYPFRNGHYAFELTHQQADFVKPIVHQTMREYGYSTGAIGKMDSYIYTVPNIIGYTTAKTAVLGLTRGLSAEWSAQGVRVNAIAPGWIHTPMTDQAFEGDPDRKAKVLSRTPMNQMGQPEDIAQSAVYLCSPAAKFITGQCLNVDGGASIGF